MVTESSSKNTEESLGNGARVGGRARRARRMFSGFKIRKKLIVLHTLFSIFLGGLLMVAMVPAMGSMVDAAEQDLSELVINLHTLPVGELMDDHLMVQSLTGTADELGIGGIDAQRLRNDPKLLIPLAGDAFEGGGGGVLWFDSRSGEFVSVRSHSLRARQSVRLMYGLVIGSLLAGYVLVAVALEIFVLPEHVYKPIQALLEADDAARSKDQANELVPAELIPADELGEIMHSRNETVRKLRSNERELAEVLGKLEAVAIDVHTKNRLLETARKNLEGADRLATMGMMSAGIAHELNTPLSVVKGLVGRLEGDQGLSESEIKLLIRVVGRIEKLSEGLLDFARVRAPSLKVTGVREVIEEAWTLVKLDRQSVLPGQQVEFVNSVDAGLEIACDSGRMVQVFVNLIRNASHALHAFDGGVGRIEVSAVEEDRDDGAWVVISVADNGGGIEPEMIDSLFEPFVSSRLDSQGTGLGLAVADGIVREHGGVVVPSNLGVGAENSVGNRVGAKFDVHLPVVDAL